MLTNRLRINAVFFDIAGHCRNQIIHRVFCVVFHSRFASVASTKAWVDALEGNRPIGRDSIWDSYRRAHGLLAVEAKR
ncbi:hypothetical protein [Budvicia diplopodorum]|uniref:hypothetical protein n=1 Tax=Budvicia diplopodorum TaxID=1119056 RepID=UPI0013578994|nr:hypothetical protein [Budvicia diplopodorum]